MIKESQLLEENTLYRDMILAGDYWMKEIKAGQTFRILDLEGNQAHAGNNG